MGNCCGPANVFLSPEDLIIDTLVTDTFKELSESSLATILFNHIQGGNEEIAKTNMGISENAYLLMAEDIIRIEFAPRTKSKEKIKDNHPELFRKFVKGLYPLININNTKNAVIYKLIMFPLIMDEEPDKEKTDKAEKEDVEKLKEELFVRNAQRLFHLIKFANFNNEKIDTKNLKSIKYTELCNAFTIYFSMILVGFTKIIFSSLEGIKEYDENFRKEFEEHVNKYFKKDYIVQFYQKKVAKSLLKEFESQNEIALTELNISEDEFVELCKNKRYLLNYTELRENYIAFVDTILDE